MNQTEAGVIEKISDKTSQERLDHSGTMLRKEKPKRNIMNYTSIFIYNEKRIQ